MYKINISSRVFLPPRNTVYCCEGRWVSIIQVAVQRSLLLRVSISYIRSIVCITVACRQLLHTCKIYIKEAAAIPLHERSSPIAATTVAGVGYLASNTQMNVRDITKTVNRDRQIKRFLNALYLHTYTHRLTEHNALVRTIHILCTYRTRVLGLNVHSDWRALPL